MPVVSRNKLAASLQVLWYFAQRVGHLVNRQAQAVFLGDDGFVQEAHTATTVTSCGRFLPLLISWIRRSVRAWHWRMVRSLRVLSMVA